MNAIEHTHRGNTLLQEPRVACRIVDRYLCPIGEGLRAQNRPQSYSGFGKQRHPDAIR